MSTTRTSEPPAAHLSDPASDTSNGIDRLWETSVGHDTAFLLARANALSLTRVHKRLKRFGLEVRSYSVLAIAVEDARPSQRELSEFLRLDPSQIVALVDKLQDAGLIVREPDPRDRRANVVVATDAGRALAALARQEVVASDQEWFSLLPEESREGLFAALRTLAADSGE